MGKVTDMEIGAQAILWASANPQYASTCTIRVSSHQRRANPDGMGLGLYDLSQDAVTVEAEESFVGQSATIVLLPRRPYQEWLFPGDWISIYFGTGVNTRDGFGVYQQPEQEGDNVRAFFGFIDSVRTSVSIEGSSGSAQVSIQVTCSGIQKAFQRTMIYHNPMLGPETLFGAILPGMANLMKGLAMSGTPATIPRSIAMSHLGFGGQFTMPDSYAGLVPSNLTKAERVKNLLKDALALEQALGFNFGKGLVGKPQEEGLVERSLRVSKEKFTARSLAQVLDLFSYVEDLYVDGRIVQTPIHDLNGNLWELMQENCNPILNECYVTLLPDIGGIIPGDKDEWGMSPKYMPALVIRERPFSWLDGRAFAYGGSGIRQWTFKAPSLHGKFQDFPFGDVAFSSRTQKADVPVKQQFVRPPSSVSAEMAARILSIQTRYEPQKNRGRFVDRIKITNQDIFNETLGMSDNDHYNFIMISQANNVISTQNQKFTLLNDGMVPTFLAESIKRYGLRVKELQTKFLNTGGSQIQSKGAMDLLIRSLLCWDMWYQHQPWYRAGTFSCKGIPRARIGMYLDVEGFGREESFYIEAVSHSWVRSPQVGTGHLFTNMTVTRGQPGLTAHEKRFVYAPQDPVRIYVGGKEIPRQDAKSQPVTIRSPYPTPKAQVDKYYEIVSGLVVPSPPPGYTPPDKVFVTQYEFREFEKMIDNITQSSEMSLTVATITRALKKVIGDTRTSIILKKFDVAIQKVEMPPIHKQKEDRMKAGKPPWAEQEALRGQMWDPIARLDDNDQSSSFTKAVNSLHKGSKR